MSTFVNSIPASLRKPVESSRVAQSSAPRVARSNPSAGGEVGAISINTSRYVALPQEPDDARMTGVTRSLNRRLTALNISGSFRIAQAQRPVAKIA